MKLRLLYLLVLPMALAASADVSPPDSVRVIPVSDGVALKFKWIPPGRFMMGSPAEEPHRDGDEGPQHLVKISKGFYLGLYEVTQRQWEAMMGSNPAIFQQGNDNLDRPVESVSWNDVQKFIDLLNTKGFGNFRLPTEAEWEYACRAGTETPYYWPNPDDWIIHQYAWCNSRSFATPHPVGEKIPNPWGLYDMSGNVWEWCQDWYSPYTEGMDTDPKGPPSGTEKVFRGGSWFDFPNSQRSANRHRHGIDKGYTAIGFRLVLEEE